MPLTGFPYPLACREYRDERPYPLQCEDLRDIVEKVCPTYAPETSPGSGQCTGGALKVCPSGYGPDRPTNRCIRLSPPTCPTGSTLHIAMARGEINRYPICIPDSVQLPEQSPPSNSNAWPCAQGVDFLAINPQTGKFKCVPPAGGSGTTPTPSSGGMSSAPTSTPAPVTPPVDVQTTLEDINQSLKPFRPPTSPGSDKAIERKAILSGNQSLVFIQLVLFILLAVLVAYLLLPPNYANAIAFVLLCVGVAYGFFLRR